MIGIALSLSIAGCGLASVRGSGKVVTQPRSVSGFRSVSLSGSGKLVIDRNGTESLTITADDNLLPYLTSEVRDGELRLDVKPGANIDPSQRIVYNVTARDLDGISVSGSGDVTASGVDTHRLAIDGSGSSEFTIAGRADEQRVSLSGSGRYQGADLASKVVSIDISGSGRAVVAVSDKLDVDVSGSGTVDYIGNPQVTQSVSGSGSIRRR